MPINYNPGIQYRGDQYLYQGISGAGEALGAGVKDYLRRQQEAKQEMELQERQDTQNKIIMDHAAQSGLVTPEELSAYYKLPLKKRVDTAKGYGATIATQFAVGQQKQKAMYQAAQVLNLGANTANTNQRTYAAQKPLQVAQIPNADGKPSGREAIVGGGIKRGNRTRRRLLRAKHWDWYFFRLAQKATVIG